MNMRRDPMIYVAAALIVAAFLTAAWMVFAASSRQLTSLESVLFQILIFAAGLSGSFIAGRNSSLKAAQEMIRPHARSAFRRLFSMNRSLQNLSAMISEMRRDKPDQRLDTIQSLVNEQIWTGQDSLADWRDIIPEDMAEFERRQAGNGNER